MKIRLASLVLLIGCGGSKGGQLDAAPGSPDAGPKAPDARPRPDAKVFDARPKPDAIDSDAGDNSTFGSLMPQAVVSNASDILASPNVVPITFSDDPNVTNINSFYSAFGASTAWSDQTAEYGIGQLTEGTPRDLGPMPKNTTEQALLNTLSTNLTNGNWGSPDANTVYAFMIPSGVKFNQTGECCNSYDGYHWDTRIGSVDVAYSINCECPAEANSFGISLFEDMGVTMGHEVVEAASDPFGTAWAQTDDAHAAWTYATEGELGDLCEFADTEVWLDAFGSDAVQRTWSNKAAAAGHDPCVGEGSVPYYMTIPTDPDSGTVNFGFSNSVGNPNWAAKGTRIAKGASGTVTLQVFSDIQSSGPYKVSLSDLNTWFGGSALMTFVQPTGTYMSGDTATASITINALDPGMTGGETYVVQTTPAAGGPTTYYFALVIQ